ncbi:MAG: cell division FtsA domain-containing protein [bacterium]
MNELMALDIGTGTVIGFLARKKGENLELLARCEVKHDQRAIEEGRVVDVKAASETVKKAVEELRNVAKTEINVAHFAVPGRGLKIKEVEAGLEFKSQREVTVDDVKKLFAKKSSIEDNHAVIDEEIISKKADDKEIINFEGQYAARIEARWLITTLDLQDVQNKKNVLKEAGLVPGQLILEPRAAVLAAMPGEEFEPRVGLIDFGAGTIDAALIEEGKIRDFCTLQGSGDKLTRKLEEILLIDFNRAEQIKKKLHDREEVEFEKISGETEKITRAQMCRWLNPVVAEELRPLRDWFKERQPELLFLAGGGSQYPGIKHIVARILKIEDQEIISRPPWTFRGVEDPQQLLSSSADFTAFGLLLAASAGRGRYCLDLTVNGEQQSRLVSGEEYLVSDLIKDLGYQTYQPHPEAAKMIKIDGEWETVKKEQELKPIVEVNNQKASAETRLRSGDSVDIMPAEKPEPVEVMAGDFLPSEKLHLKWQGKDFELPPRLKKTTGEIIYSSEELEDGAEYSRLLSYSRQEIVEYLQRRGVKVPESLLWLKNGTFSTEERYDIGEQIEVKAAADPGEFGLNRLDNLPANLQKPLPYSLN